MDSRFRALASWGTVSARFGMGDLVSQNGFQTRVVPKDSSLGIRESAALRNTLYISV
ncbi:hypothetical protein GCM10007096_42450 [Pullulanibacillus pueri]|uniref:Uncharacterized protein n=1 Tax=Pullulanibacillus pueri TaxID=1437324 RepID=A0A8J3EPS1_9BACL|nr:hypothetical protein GCM10007096_42450 [Pullulanibacillus pueri]